MMMGSHCLRFQFGLGECLEIMCFFLNFCRIFWSSCLRGIYRYLYKELSEQNQDLWEFQTQCTEIEEAVEAARMDRWVQSFTSQNFDSRLASVAQHDSRLASVAQQISTEDLTAPQPLEGQRISHGLAQSEPSGKLVRKKVDNFLSYKKF